MSKTKKLKALIVSALCAALMLCTGFALGELIPARADENLVLDGQSEYTLFGNPKAEEIYDEKTNSYECSTSTLILIQFTTEERTAKFRYSISKDDSSYGVNVYYDKKFDPDNKFSYYSHYGTVGSVKGSGTVTQGTDEVGKVDFQDGIVTFTGDAQYEYYFINIYASSNAIVTVSGLRQPTYYDVTTSIEGDAHGTVTMADETTSAEKTSLTTQVCSGKPLAMTAKPDDGYFPIWKDEDGTILARGDSYTPKISSESQFNVSFEKLGDNNMLITYDSLEGDNQFKWQNTDGKYSIENPSITAVVTEQTQSSAHIDFHVEGAAILTFDYSLLRASNENNTYNNAPWGVGTPEYVVDRTEGNPSHWTKALVMLDGVNVPATTTIKYKTHGKTTEPNKQATSSGPVGQYSGSAYQMNIGLGRTGEAGSGSSDIQSISVYVDTAGSHTLEIRFTTAPYTPSETASQWASGVEHNDEMPEKEGEAFSFENVQLTEKTARTFTLKYDENLGDITTDGLGVSEGEPCKGGKTFTLYDDFPITLTATAKKSITSSLDDTKTVDAHFIEWTLGDQSSKTETCTLEFKNGKLYFNSQPVDETEIFALFEEEVVAPTIWTKINDSLEAGDAAQQITKDKTEISVDFSTAKNKSLFVLFDGYGEEDAIEFTVNGENENAMSVDKNGNLDAIADVLTDEMKQTFATDTVNWWLAQQLGTQYEIKLTISKEGYFGTAEAVIYVVYTTGEAIAAKQPDDLPEGANFAKDYQGKNDVKSAFNRLFTEESEAGAYFATTSAGEWSSTAEFDGGDTETAVFEGKYDPNKHDKMTPDGMSQDHWSVSMLQIRDYYISADKKYVHYQGVLSFDVYLEVRKGAGIATRDAVILVERRDAYSSISDPEKHDGNGVITEKVSNVSTSGQSIQAADSDLIGLVDHKSSVSIWTGNSNEANSFVTALGDGWYRCVIPTVRESAYQSSVQRDLEQVDGKYVHKTSEFRLIFATHPNAEARYAIRNVSFRKGTEANFKFSVNDDTYLGNVTAQAGETLTINDSKTLGFGSTVTLTATAPDGKKFYGWEVISKDGKSSYLPSTSVEKNTYTLRYTLIDPVEIKAWFGDEEEFSARYEGKYYKTLNEAMKAAETSGGDVYLIHNTTIEESLIIPQNVRVIIPFDESGSFMGSASTGYDSQKRIAWAEKSLVDKYRYLTITLGEGVQVTINGGLYLGGVVNYADQGYQGHTSGAYSELILKKDSQIIVKSGGVFDVYGRVWGGEGATDMGTITAEKGGKIYEPFLILDFSGGSITLDLFMANITPFKRYAMINIECPMTINYGAQLIGHATLYVAQFKEFYSLDQPFISDDKGGDTMIMLKDGASVTITYDPNKIVDKTNVTNCTELIGQTKLVFNGGAKFSYMLFSALGLEVPTAGVYFSIPYNFDVELNGEKALYETVTDFMIMPGASVKVGAGATLTLHANAWVYGGFNAPANAGSKSYPTAAQLEAAGYSKSGHLIIDGTLKIDKKWAFDEDRKPTAVGATAATFLGIVETSGQTGRIEIASDAILSGTIKDGTDNCKNYFAYKTTARVWDRAHSTESELVFGDLKAGHTYTATSGEGFTLTELNYTNAEGGKEDQKLELNSDMVGSWMIEHEGHNFDWAITDEEKGEGFFGEENHKTVSRKCTELGCTEEAHKTLYKPVGAFENQVYNGSAFNVEALFTTLFGEKDAYQGYQLAEGKQELKDADTYSITITLDETLGYFVVDGAFKTEATFSFTIDPFDISSLSNEKYTVTGLGNVIYNGEEQTPNFSLTAKDLGGITGEISFDKDSLVWTANKEAGTASVKVTGNGNFTGELTINFSIKPKEITVTLIEQTHTYDGNVPAPKSVKGTDWTVDPDAICGEDDLGVTLSLKDGGKADVGHYTIVGQASNQNYIVSFSEADLEITQRDISEDGVLTLKEGPFTYNGEEQKPFESFSLTGFETLAQGTDFKVTYENNTAASDMGATVTVEGTGNFTGSVKKNFTIEQFELKGENTEIGAIASVTYNGTEQQQKPTSVQVTIGEKQFTLNEETDYTVSWSEDCTNAVTVTVTLTGAGNYKGGATTTYQIEKAQVTITAENKNSPKGEEIVDLTATVTGLCGSDTFTKGVEYSLSTDATKESDVGSDYTITVKILDVSKWTNYTVGKADGTYTITAAVFGKVKFGSGETVYDREAHEWTVTNLENADGQEGHFETPVYSYQKDGKPVEEMKEAGEYQVTAELKFIEEGGQTYTTTLTATYTIKKAEISSLTIAEGPYTYTGSAIAPEITVESKNGLTLTEGEYTVSYGSGNVNAGKVTVTVTGSGNFQGTAQNTFTIDAKDIAEAKVSASGEYTYQGSAIVPEKGNVTVTLEGFEVTFDVSASNNTNAGEATLTVTGNGNFQGTAEGRFTIDTKKITVKIQSQTLTYSGTDVPALDNDRWTTEGLCSGDDKASLQVTLHLTEEKERWDAKTYTGVIDGVSKNGNYEVTFEKGNLTINKKNITVTIEDKQSVYGDEYEELTFTPNGDLAAGDDNAALHVTLSFAGSDGTHLTAGDYNIIGSFAEDGNYNVTFAGSQGTAGLYSVKVRPITVKINDQSVLYNGKEPSVPQEQEEGWTITVGSIAYEDKLDILLTKAEGVSAGDYKITGSISNSNYEVTFQGSYGEDGKFKIEARTLTVVIEDQSATYNYQHQYAFDTAKWHVKAGVGDGLAEGEEKDVLAVTLTKPEMTDAGDYEIAGAWDNENYTVTFEGTKQTKGTFTVGKQDVSDGAKFILGVEGDNFTTDGARGVRAKFAGEELVLFASASYFEGTEDKKLEVTIDPAKIGEIGEFEVTVTIADTNYCGSTVFNVVVTDAAGYTKKLTEVLEQLETLAKGLDIDALKAEDYATLTEMYKAIQTLDEEERETGASALAEYQAYIDAWNALADTDAAVETAESIANGPIKGLFAGTAVMTALAALAYIVKKGGIL